MYYLTEAGLALLNELEEGFIGLKKKFSEEAEKEGSSKNSKDIINGMLECFPIFRRANENEGGNFGIEDSARAFIIKGYLPALFDGYKNTGIPEVFNQESFEYAQLLHAMLSKIGQHPRQANDNEKNDAPLNLTHHFQPKAIPYFIKTFAVDVNTPNIVSLELMLKRMISNIAIKLHMYDAVCLASQYSELLSSIDSKLSELKEYIKQDDFDEKMYAKKIELAIELIKKLPYRALVTEDLSHFKNKSVPYTFNTSKFIIQHYRLEYYKKLLEIEEKLNRRLCDQVNSIDVAKMELSKFNLPEVEFKKKRIAELVSELEKVKKGYGGLLTDRAKKEAVKNIMVPIDYATKNNYPSSQIAVAALLTTLNVGRRNDEICEANPGKTGTLGTLTSNFIREFYFQSIIGINESNDDELERVVHEHTLRINEIKNPSRKMRMA